MEAILEAPTNDMGQFGEFGYSAVYRLCSLSPISSEPGSYIYSYTATFSNCRIAHLRPS